MTSSASTVLRNLLHHPQKGRYGRALLESLCMRDGLWFDFSFTDRVPVMQEIDTCLLVGWQTSVQGPDVVPAFMQSSQPRELDFDQWWKEPIANSQRFGSYSRQEIVSFIADMEGAHVDTAFPDKYCALRDGTFVSNIRFVSPQQEPQTIPNLHTACLRHIAHETILTLHRRNRDLLRDRYYCIWHNQGRMTKLPGEP